LSSPLLRAGSVSEDGDSVVVSPELARWEYTGLRVARLAPGRARDLLTAGFELAVLPLEGSLTVECDGHRVELAGRETVFSGVSDWVYIPVGSEVRLASDDGAEVALCTAQARRRLELHHGRARDVPVEIRGSGRASRQIVNFMAPDAFAGAERLMCVEVYTPAGNTSSYPPHKHDDSPECPVELEEIYYFRIGRTGTTATSREGFGLHRTYTADRALDATVEVRDGDVFLVPRGYHGPCVACPGYPMYYLNVLAGPSEARSLAFVDDPAHAWIRESWSAEEPDPRLPMVSSPPDPE
jgi:5-deoxy-glucuronate isomerase